MNLTSQGYYNLIVYESDPEDIPHLFERTGEHEDGEVLEWVNEALSYLNDRLEDESYSDEDEQLPTEDELVEKVKKLENIRIELSVSQLDE